MAHPGARRNRTVKDASSSEVPAHPAGLLTRLQHWMAAHQWQRRFVLWTGALATGVLAVLFARLGDQAIRMFQWGTTLTPYWPWAVPPIGLACLAWLTRHVFPGSQGSGIPQTIAALSHTTEEARHRLLSLRIAAGKLLVTALALGCGASVGREGPTVQIGASIMYSIRRWARFPARDVERGLILAGGAAGVAAAFNTPLAGVVFAIEELSRSFEERTSGTILTAVILAGVASVALAGNYTYFGLAHESLSSLREWIIVPICGIAGGVAGGLFSRAMLACQRSLPHAIRRIRDEQPVRFALLCGLGVAIIGWVSAGTTFGTGYAQAKALVQQDDLMPHGFAVYKALATLLSYLSGVPAGIFSPSLAIGAGIGGELGRWVHLAPGAAFVVLTMAAYFAGVVQAPLTALVIVTEMTANRDLTLPLMAVVFIGRGASALVCRESLYRALAQAFMPPDRPKAHAHGGP